MELTVLGKSPAWQDAGGACSGYLVATRQTILLLDCGNGVLGKLRSVCDYARVDAVVISHLHADHILDLVPYASALTYAPRHQPVPVDGHPGTTEPPRPRLIAPRRSLPRACPPTGEAAVVPIAVATRRQPRPHRLLATVARRHHPRPHRNFSLT